MNPTIKANVTLDSSLETIEYALQRCVRSDQMSRSGHMFAFDHPFGIYDQIIKQMTGQLIDNLETLSYQT